MPKPDNLPSPSQPNPAASASPVAATATAAAPGRSATAGTVHPIGGADGRVRAVVEAVLPCVDGGRFAAKRVAGEPARITAHCFTDGHDVLRVALQWWRDTSGDATAQPADAIEVAMQASGNDEWIADFTPPEPGLYRYTVAAWVDPFESWRRELERRVDPQDIRIAARVGAAEALAAAQRADKSPRTAAT